MTRKPLLLLVALILIGGAVWYLESQKSGPPAGDVSNRIALVPRAVDELATSTVRTTSATATSEGLGAESAATRDAGVRAKTKEYPSGIELIPGGQFINTAPFTLKSLVGKKVILVDFWTYSCINCLRTLPYLKAWYAAYKDMGFEIIGVHTPEFDFEKDAANVAQAAKNLGVLYPVVQDNNYATWNAYANRYWPHEYLIDIDGFIVHDHIGEGGYVETERAIQQALAERAQVLGTKETMPAEIVTPADAVAFNPAEIESPETYFGSARNEYLGNGVKNSVGPQALAIPSQILPNQLYLGGDWNFLNEYAENASAKAEVVFRYSAKNVYIVASSATGAEVQVFLDGKAVQASADLTARSTLFIKEHRLYKVINGQSYGVHTLRLIISKPGLQVFTFTFG